MLGDQGQGCMGKRLPASHSSTLDAGKTTADAVLKAFEKARTEGRPSVECYHAGVAAWRLAHPEQAPEYAAKRAVAVILSAHLTLRGEA
jgi:hypothetical protein